MTDVSKWLMGVLLMILLVFALFPEAAGRWKASYCMGYEAALMENKAFLLASKGCK